MYVFSAPRRISTGFTAKFHWHTLNLKKMKKCNGNTPVSITPLCNLPDELLFFFKSHLRLQASHVCMGTRREFSPGRDNPKPRRSSSRRGTGGWLIKQAGCLLGPSTRARCELSHPSLLVETVGVRQSVLLEWSRAQVCNAVPHLLGMYK